MDSLTEKIIARAKSLMWQYAEIAPQNIAFSQDVVNACKANYCGNYNKCWTCPPNVGSLEELKLKYQSYRHAFVFTTKHAVEDSFDLDGMLAARAKHDAVENVIREVLPLGCEVLGAEGCLICEKCAFPAPCRFPERARRAVEACGIDVVALSRTAQIDYYNGENTVTYFSLIFW